MTLYRATFDKYEEIAPRNVYLSVDKIIEAIDMRSIIVKNIVRGKINRIPIKDAFHVSKMQVNMFLVKELVSNNLKIQFNLNECFVKTCDGKAIAIMSRKDNLYEMNFTKVHESDAANLVQFPTGDGTLKLWHHCLSHLNVKGVHTF